MYIIMSASGLEPETNGLKGRCSTIELRARPVLSCEVLSKRIELLFLPWKGSVLPLDEESGARRTG